MSKRELILRVTAKDCDWEYYRGSGNGGQKKQKTSSAVRCRHKESGAVGKAQDTRSKEHNRRLAFRRMYESDIFQKWLKMEIARISGHQDAARQYAEREINSNNIQIEVKKDGKWTKEILNEN